MLWPPVRHGKARVTETEEGKQTRLRAAERDSGPRDAGRQDLQLFTGKKVQQPQDRYDPVPPQMLASCSMPS